MFRKAKGRNESPDEASILKSPIGVNYEECAWSIAYDATSGPFFIFGRRYERRVTKRTKLSNTETTPSLPLFIMAAGMGEKITITLSLNQLRSVKEQNVVELPKDPNRRANGRARCSWCNLHKALSQF